MSNNDVFLYALSTCVHCKKAKEYLEEKGVNYDVCYVDRLAGKEREDAISAVKKHNPALSFPTIVIGDDVIVGFNENAINSALS